MKALIYWVIVSLPTAIGIVWFVLKRTKKNSDKGDV